MPTSSITLSTPTCAIPLAPPPPSARPTLGRCEKLDGIPWPTFSSAEADIIPRTAESKLTITTFLISKLYILEKDIHTNGQQNDAGGYFRGAAETASHCTAAEHSCKGEQYCSNECGKSSEIHILRRHLRQTE